MVLQKVHQTGTAHNLVALKDNVFDDMVTGERDADLYGSGVDADEFLIGGRCEGILNGVGSLCLNSKGAFFPRGQGRCHATPFYRAVRPVGQGPGLYGKCLSRCRFEHEGLIFLDLSPSPGNAPALPPGNAGFGSQPSDGGFLGTDARNPKGSQEQQE